MTPLPQSKTAEIGQQLWNIFLHDQDIPEFSRRRFRHELEKLKKADYLGYLSAKGLLEAIEGNTGAMLKLAREAIRSDPGSLLLMNWANMLRFTGHIAEAYAFALKAWEGNPMNAEIVQEVIGLAQATGDMPTLEKAVASWSKLNPDFIHPDIALHLLESRQDIDDTELVQSIEIMLEHADAPVPPFLSERKARLVAALLDKVDE